MGSRGRGEEKRRETETEVKAKDGEPDQRFSSTVDATTRAITCLMQRGSSHPSFTQNQCSWPTGSFCASRLRRLDASSSSLGIGIHIYANVQEAGRAKQA